MGDPEAGSQGAEGLQNSGARHVTATEAGKGFGAEGLGIRMETYYMGDLGILGRELVAVIDLWAQGLGGSMAGNALGKSILGSHYPDNHPSVPPLPIGEACWWTTHPASKQRSEGEKVRVGDDLILVSVSSERYLVSSATSIWLL